MSKRPLILQREQMSAALRLSRSGLSVKQIADRFGWSTAKVLDRIRLAERLEQAEPNEPQNEKHFSP
jgi:hypothetical protein